MNGTVKDRFHRIMERMAKAALRSGRAPEQVRLVAVTKTRPIEDLRQAVDAGIESVGENYVQEARDKFDLLADAPLQWHLIGHLQTNKAKYAVRMFDLIHTVDSFKLASELDRQAAKAGKIQSVLIQVNIGEEKSKSGAPKALVRDLLEKIGKLPNLNVKGLMTIPPFFDAPEKARPAFADLRHLRDDLMRSHIEGIDLGELSMGMSGDFEVAIEEGATIVRIGTALFGERR